MQTTAVTSAAPPPRYDVEPALVADSSMPDDVLSQLLHALEELGRTSLELGETRVRSTRVELRQSLEQLVEDMRKAAERARKAADDGGFFSDVVGAVASVFGKVAGTYTDAVLPIDSVVTLVDGLARGENVLAALRAGAVELGRNGETADKVSGFTEGVVAFSADVAAFQAKLQAVLARAAITGEDPLDLVAADARELVGSLRENILENPDFWAVTAAAAKGAAVAGAVVTGGAAIAALVLVAALEVDARTSFIEKGVGKDAAPWVRVALAVSACACAVAATGGPEPARLLDSLSGGLEGANALASGYRAVVEANRQADALDDSADSLESLNRIHQLQRLLGQLVEALESDHEDHSTTRELGADLMQTRAAMGGAWIVPA